LISTRRAHPLRDAVGELVALEDDFVSLQCRAFAEIEIGECFLIISQGLISIAAVSIAFADRWRTSLEAAFASGDAVRGPIRKPNRALLAQHVGAWLALVHLPDNPVIDYKISQEELLESAVWFGLRGMGVTDKAIATYFNARALALSFADKKPARAKS